MTAAAVSFPTQQLLAICVGLLIVGCAPLSERGPRHATVGMPREEKNIHLYTVVAHKTGEPIRPSFRNGKVNLELMKLGEDGKPAAQAYFEEMASNIEREAPIREGKKQILVFIHGGMNEKKGAVLRSARLVPRIRDPRQKESFYPVFIDWNSAPFSSYTEHLTKIRAGGSNPGLAWPTLPFVLASDVARGIGRAPVVWVNQLGYILPAIQTRKRIIAAQEVLKSARRTTGKGPVVTEETMIALDQRRFPQHLADAAHWPFFAAKAGTSVLIDTIGTSAWDMMLRRAYVLFDSPTSSRELNDTEKQDVEEISRIVNNAGNQPLSEGEKRKIGEIAKKLQTGRGYPSKSRPGAVEQFLRALKAHMGKNPEQRYSITLVGHSMGAIVSNEILSRHPELPIDNIVYLAAACSVKEAQDHVGPYLRINERAKFSNICLHPFADAIEANPSPSSTPPKAMELLQAPLGYLVPRGSLLEWLDAFFTKPLTREDRRLGKWRNSIVATDVFPEEVRERVHMKMLPVGNPKLPEKHGDLASENLETMFWETAFRQTGPSPL